MIKSLEQLRYYVKNYQYLEVIDQFLKFKATTLKIIDSIEKSILNATIYNTPQEMIGIYDDLGNMEIIDWIQQISINESDQVLKGIKQTKSNIQKLVKTYEITLKKQQQSLLKVLEDTLNKIDNQIVYNENIIITRLKKRDEGIELEKNGILFDGTAAAVCVFQPKIDGLLLKGLHQPALFDGLYYEQPLNFKEIPQTIKYSLHKGLDLRNSLYEEELILFDPEITKADQFNYQINFTNEIQLEKDCMYTIQASASQDSFFGFLQYYEREQDNPFIKFCDQQYSLNNFRLPQHIQQLHCEKDRGLFTALIVSEE